MVFYSKGNGAIKDGAVDKLRAASFDGVRSFGVGGKFGSDRGGDMDKLLAVVREINKFSKK